MKKISRYIRFVLILIASLQLSAYSKAQSWQFKAFELSEEPGSARIQATLKSNNGYIYIGSDQGLSRFDGMNFNPIFLPEKLESISITSLFEDSESKIWIGFQNGSIGWLEQDKFYLYQSEDSLPAVDITFITEDAIGRIWVATGGEGIYVIANNVVTHINSSDGLADDFVYTLLLVKDNAIASGTDRGLSICRLENEKKNIKTFGTLQGLPDNIVRVIKKQNDDWLWLGFHDKGICRFNISTGSFDASMVSSWKYGQVNDVLTLGTKMWIGTEKQGVITYSPSNMFSRTFTGNFNKISSFLRDREGNIWITNPNTLVRTIVEQLKLIIPYDEAFAKNVHAILPDSKGNIWTTQKNKVICFTIQAKEFHKKVFTIPGMDKVTDITSLYEDVFGNIWIGTMGRGLYILNPTAGTIGNMKGFLRNGSILSISGKGNDVWITSLGGVIKCRLKNENANISSSYTLTNYNYISGIGSDFVYDIFIDSRNRVWFATDGKGLSVYENNKFTTYSEKNGLKSNVIYSVTEDRLGNIWFSTLNAGLYRFDGKSFENFSKEQGIMDLNVSSLTTDNSGNIICVTAKGIYAIEPSKKVLFNISPESAGFKVNNDLNSTGSNRQAVFISTSQGILAYHATVYKTIFQPTTLIDKISLYLNEIDYSSIREFSYNQNNLSFSFLGLYYSDADKVQYQYKLDGYNSEWVFTKDRFVNFPNLAPGNYVFRVRSSLTRNFNNAIEAKYAFSVAKPFWKTYWFIISAILMIGGLLFYLMKLRERSLKKWDSLEKDKIQAQYETLKSQVNPHFLFNSFNTLINMIEEDQDKAVDYVQHLSDFYRNIISYRENDLITLEEELKLIQNYFFIQEKRFGNTLQFEQNINSEELRNYFIPVLTLQLLAENAVKHNAISQNTPLVLSMYMENDRYIVIKNNINQKMHKEPGTGLGLQNVIHRYKLLSNKEVLITNENDHFTVYLPLIKEAV